MDGGSGPCGHRRGSVATELAESLARAAVKRLGMSLEIGIAWSPSLHVMMMPSNRSKRNPDPSRAAGAPFGLCADGTPADGHDDRGVLRGSVGVGDWHNAADGAGLVAGRLGCNNADLDHSGSRERKPHDSCSRSKRVAAEPLRPASSVPVRRAGQRLRFSGRLEE